MSKEIIVKTSDVATLPKKNVKKHLSMEEYEQVCITERIMEYSKWTNEIPFLNFDADWNIKIIPPYARAVARFIVEHNNKSVSVYLDCYDALGCCNAPYWEIYPHFDETFRCGLHETKELIVAIREELNNVSI